VAHLIPPADLLSAENLRAGVSAALDTRLQQLRALAVSLDPAAIELVSQCEALLGGGKRLRAALAYWSFRAHGGAAEHLGAYHLGAALELFQASALFHDDILDNSDVRRGAPTAHRAFASLHKTTDLIGDSDQFGVNAAILLGDLALTLAYEELESAITAAQLSPANAQSARQLFSHMCQEVMIGQYLDVRAENEPLTGAIAENGPELRRAATILRAKSASYCVKYPLLLGAVLAGFDDPEQLQQLSEIGEKLGIAFQLRDDILGIFGDPTITGKPAGDDLIEGKRTVLLLRAIMGSPPGAQAELLAAVGNPQLDAPRLAELRNIIVSSGALVAVENQITELAALATSALANLNLHMPGREMLSHLANALVTRAA